MEWSPLSLTLMLITIGVVAFLYSSVGHGGATGYLAVMSLCGVAPVVARPGALWMNCVVASVAFWRFRRAGFFDASIFLPLAVASVPMAWLGSWLHLDGRAYSLVLGVALLSAGWMLGWRPRPITEGSRRPVAMPYALGAGAGLGFLAGLTGIGGGVYLTPMLILLGWTPAKTAGGISALFIVVNSVAGLVGLGSGALVRDPVLLFAPVLGLAAALAATALSVQHWNSLTFRRVLAVVLCIAAVKNFTEVLS